MLYEPTTLASVARRIGETLSADYDLDPKPMFAKLGIDTGKFLRPGSRVPFAKMNELWRQSIEATDDPWFGFAVGARAMPGDFFVLGYFFFLGCSWLIFPRDCSPRVPTIESSKVHGGRWRPRFVDHGLLSLGGS